MEGAERAGTAALVQKQIDQIEADDDRDRGSMVLVDSFIGDDGATVVADTLRNNFTVKSLDMRGCNVRAEGAVALAEMLDNNMHLTSLGLEWNSIGMFESGMQRLCQSIARNSSLTELDLRNNGISSYGGALLGEMLTKSSSLKRIDLRWNNLGASGGKSLLDGLQRNGCVIELMLTGNKVSDETLRAVEQCLIKNRGQKVDYISESVLVDEHISRHASPTTIKPLASPGARGTPHAPGSSRSNLHIDLSSPVCKSSPLDSKYETDTSRLFSQASKLRNSLSGDVLEQNFREKLSDLSRALVSEKEANLSLEKRYCEEVEYRATLEGKLLEFERLLRTAEESLLNEKSLSEVREAEVHTSLEKEKGLRHLADQQLLSTKLELSEVSKKYQEHVQQASRKIADLDEQKQAADKRLQRLTEDLRQTEDQREHLDRVYHASVAKVAEIEALLTSVRGDLGAQVKSLKEKLEKESADRNHLEDTHLRETRTLNDRIRSLTDTLEEEKALLGKAKEELQTMTQARDRLQTRLNHLMDEATDLRKELGNKRMEFETKIEAEIDLREKTENMLIEKTAQYEQLRVQHDRYKENMEKRIATLEEQVVGKDKEMQRMKEEEARRIVSLEDRLLQSMRAEIAKASPNKGQARPHSPGAAV